MRRAAEIVVAEQVEEHLVELARHTLDLGKRSVSTFNDHTVAHPVTKQRQCSIKPVVDVSVPPRAVLLTPRKGTQGDDDFRRAAHSFVAVLYHARQFVNELIDPQQPPLCRQLATYRFSNIGVTVRR